MTLQEQIDMMIAFRDGAEIECFSGMMLMTNPPQEQWVVTTNPLWNWERNNYRIKEAPKTVTLYYFQNPLGQVRISTQPLDYNVGEVRIRAETVEVEG